VLIRVELYGYHPQQQEFEITNEVMTFIFELEEIVHESTIVINTSPPGALIYLNGEVAGTSPLTRTVPPGMHTVVARSPGHESATVSIPVTGNETANIVRTLMLMPTVTDPFANHLQPPVEPIPPAGTTPVVPFPTVPPPYHPTTPTVPFPTVAPPYQPLPDVETPPPAGFPEPTPERERQWWEILPGH
jgi:hypothetical protein